MAPFMLSKVNEKDFHQLVDLEFKAFEADLMRDIFMGPDTDQGHEALANRYISYSRDDPNDFWVKVVDKSNGRIIAASNWKICPGRIPNHEANLDTTMSWLQSEPERLAAAKKIMSMIIQARERLYKEPYVQLHICFTDPDYARRGAGGMMLAWGTELADHLGLPSWVEASPAGQPLYARYGFVVCKVKEPGVPGSIMCRPARSKIFEGGRD